MRQYKNWLIAKNGDCFSIRLNRKMNPQILGTGNNKYRALGYREGIYNKHIKVSRLVAFLYIPNPENKPCVNHIDGNKLNDNYKNLEWATVKENADHSYRTKLRHSKRFTGISSILKIDVSFLRSQYDDGFKQSELAALYNINQSNISRLLNYKNYVTI